MESTEKWDMELNEVAQFLQEKVSNNCSAYWNDDTTQPPAFIVNNKDNNKKIVITYVTLLNIGLYKDDELKEVFTVTDDKPLDDKKDVALRLLQKISCNK